VSLEPVEYAPAHIEVEYSDFAWRSALAQLERDEELRYLSDHRRIVAVSNYPRALCRMLELSGGAIRLVPYGTNFTPGWIWSDYNERQYEEWNRSLQ